MKESSARFVDRQGIFAWIAVAIGTVLLIPLVAMQFSGEVEWTAFDFAAAGGLMFVTASLLVLAARMLRTMTSRVIACGAVLAAFVYVWVELAVGVFTDLGS